MISVRRPWGGGVGAEHGAPDAGVLMLARGSVGAAAGTEFEFANSKCSSNSCHSSVVGSRYSASGGQGPRLSRKAR